MEMFIQIEKNHDGSHAFQHGGTLQEGWAYWDTDSVPLPESFPWVDIVVEDVTHPEIKDEENGKVLEAEYKQPEVVSATDGEVIEVSIGEMKAAKIAQSKTKLAEYLSAHPLTWTDGNQYSVTAEKQSLLTGNLSAYSIAVNLGVTPNPLSWNTTGSECTEWTFANLGALALAIQAYVKPFVSYQQSKELEIKACTTAEDAKAVVIDYSSVAAQ